MFCGCLGKKLSTLISCERALHLGDKVKTGRARGAREQTRKRGVRGGGVAPARLASFAQIGELTRRLVRLGLYSHWLRVHLMTHPFRSNVVRKDNLLAPFLLEIQQGEDVGVASFTYTTIPRYVSQHF